MVKMSRRRKKTNLKDNVQTWTCEVTAGGLTLPPELVLDSFHSSVLLDKVVDDLGGLLVFQLSLVDAADIKQVLQLWVQVSQLQRQSDHHHHLKQVRKVEF